MKFVIVAQWVRAGRSQSLTRLKLSQQVGSETARVSVMGGAKPEVARTQAA